MTADMMSDICHGVGIEPSLQAVTEEQLRPKSDNREDGARLDIVAENIWGRDMHAHYLTCEFLTL